MAHPEQSIKPEQSINGVCWAPFRGPGPNSSPIAQLADPDLVRAMGTTVESALRFQPMPDDLAAAMRTGGRECMDGAFKAIKGVGLARHPNFECLVVVIAAYIASSHHIASDHMQR
jgi:hypothetical protein